MKRIVATLLLLSVSAYGRQHSLPADRLVPSGEAGTVTLTLAEYDHLVELAAKRPASMEPAPLPFVLSKASFNLKLENDSVGGDLEIDGDMLQKGPIRVPLTTGYTLLQASRPQGTLPLIHEGATHSAIIDGPGAFSVSLKLASPLTVEAGRASFALAVPSAGSARLAMELPGNHADVKVEPGLITNRSAAGGATNGTTKIEATLEPGKTARISWTTREAAAPVAQHEARFLSDIKSVISVGDSQSRIAALMDVTVVQGEPGEFKMPVPAGFEITEATGPTLESTEIQGTSLTLKVREPGRRAHQFLVVMERPSQAAKMDAPLLAFEGAQRETGEVLVDAERALELTSTEDGGLRRIDIRETSALTRSLARFPSQAAFRYQRRPGQSPKLSLEWNQFPEDAVLAAIVERATVTTLVNIEGKSLTEVSLRVRNHGQPYLKVELPPGANILSAEVAGEGAKLVHGTDGNRVPLLRPKFNPTGPYNVSFVYLTSGTPFAKNGSYALSIPKMDMPVSLLTWEVSLPDRLEIKQFVGDAFSSALSPTTSFAGEAGDGTIASDDESEFTVNAQPVIEAGKLAAGQVGGIVVDPNGAVVPNASVTVVSNGKTKIARTDQEGHWVVSGVEDGPTSVTVAASGYKNLRQELDIEGHAAPWLGTSLQVGNVSEAVTVTGSTAPLDREGRKIEEQAKKAKQEQLNAPSANVFNLQRRVAGVLPVRVDIPRVGKSYRFVRPLVLDEETKMTFQYKAK